MKLVQCENPLCNRTMKAREQVYGNAPETWATLKGSTVDRHFCSVVCLVAASHAVDDIEKDLKHETRLRDKDRAGL
jgi:hypothetical protein